MKKFSEVFYSIGLNTPLGELELSAGKEGLISVLFREENAERKNREAFSHPVLSETACQLNEYFSGERRHFDLPLKFSGSEFQVKVWRELREIEYGKTTSYLALSTKLGDKKAIRAVASANGKNPFAIIVPCHRVIGSDGSLTGYAGGLWRRQWLLEHEAKRSGGYTKLF